MRFTWLSLICLCLAVSLALPLPAQAWNKGGGLPAGWKFALSGSDVQLKDPSGNVIARFVAGTSGGISTQRLALGVDGSTMPTHKGSVWQYPDAGDGNVVSSKQVWAGTLDANDFAELVYNTATSATKYLLYAGYGHISCGNVASDGVLSAAAYVSTPLCLSDEHYNRAYNGAPKFTKGLYTPPGAGIKIGASSASEVPTTNALEIEKITGTPVSADTGSLRLYASEDTGIMALTPWVTYPTSVRAYYVMADNLAGSGTSSAANFPRGQSVSAGYGTTYAKGSKPSAPPSGSVIVYAGDDGGVAVLSVEKSGGTTHIVTIVP